MVRRCASCIPAPAVYLDSSHSILRYPSDESRTARDVGVEASQRSRDYGHIPPAVTSKRGRNFANPFGNKLLAVKCLQLRWFMGQKLWFHKFRLGICWGIGFRLARLAGKHQPEVIRCQVCLRCNVALQEFTLLLYLGGHVFCPLPNL